MKVSTDADREYGWIEHEDGVRRNIVTCVKKIRCSFCESIGTCLAIDNSGSEYRVPYLCVVCASQLFKAMLP